MSLLRIYIPADWPDAGPDTALAWCRLGSRGERLDGGVSPPAGLPRDPHCEIVVPAELVLLTRSSLPRGRGRRQPALLPYAVEDRLGVDPDSVHVAAGAQQPDGQTALAVIDKSWLDAVLARLRAAGLQPVHAWPETLLPALPEAGWVAVWSGRGGFLRSGAQSGLALDAGEAGQVPAALALALDAARAADAAPARLLLRPCAGAALPDAAAWSRALDLPVDAGAEWTPLGAHGGATGAIDLLQGAFAPAAFSLRDSQALRLPLILLSLIALVHGTASLIEWGQLRHERQQLRAAMEADFRTAFPEARVVVDAPLQMHRNLAELQRAAGQTTPRDFLPLLARAAEAFDDANRRGLRGLHYEAQSLTLEFAPGAADDALLARLRDAGLAAELRRADDAVRILVTEGAA
jgi:general secretion pathway protein L